VDLADDMRHWVGLNDGERHFILRVLAYFAASDGIVLENVGARFLNDVQIPEVIAPGAPPPHGPPAQQPKPTRSRPCGGR
jgi:hypothetical protein